MTEARIWYSRDPDQQLLPGDCQNMIVLSEELYREVQNHPIPTDLEAAKALSSSPAALDLFTWLSYRCFTAKGRERVPLFGEFGLVSQLGSVEYARPRKFREKLEGWLTVIRTMWPECPAVIDRDGTGLIVDCARAVLIQEAIMPDKGRNSTIWPIPLSQIEEIVSAHLGPGRVRGKAPVPCLSRQVSMYLAKHVAGWNLPKIGRFYNGRHHTTVLHAVEKIERLRKTDEAIDALLDVLTATLASEGKASLLTPISSAHLELIDAVAPPSKTR